MNILFVCQGNVGRSQMAEAFFKSTSHHNVSSAGTKVGEKQGQGIHELVINCMAELGYDISRNTRKQLTPELVETADRIIALTPEEDMPAYARNAKVIYWQVTDPKDAPYEFHCLVRDQIKGLVERLASQIG